MPVNTVYDGPGRGRKQCPKCEIYVGVKTGICNCGHDFSEGTMRSQNPPEVMVYDGPGRRRKQCPQCKVYLGYSTEVCPKCEHKFSAHEPTTSRSDPYAVPQTVRRRKGYTIIDTPDGRCPHRLVSPDPTDVEIWADKVLETYENDRKILTVNALCYFTREYVPMFLPGVSGENPDYLAVIRHLHDTYTDDASEAEPSDDDEDSDE